MQLIRWPVLNVWPLRPDQVTEHAAERLYHPLGGAGQTTADGIRLLRRMALDIPVYLVRLEGGSVQRLLRPVRADLVSEGRLVPGVTGYAAAFQRGEQRVLILVSRAPLRRLLREAVVWRQRDQGSPEPPPPAPPPEPPPAPLPRRKRSKGNPETRKAHKKARKLKRRQEQ